MTLATELKTSQTMQDVLSAFASGLVPGLSDATKSDYMAQIRRCRETYNANSLEDIPADLDDFMRRFARGYFPHDIFKSVAAAQTWRRKMLSALRAFHGVTAQARERRARKDGWAALIEGAGPLVESGSGRCPQMLIPVRVLADEARKVGREPGMIDNTWLQALYDTIPCRNRRTIALAVRNLELLRGLSAALEALLPPGQLVDPSRTWRARPDRLPDRLVREIDQIVSAFCAMEYDEILEEYIGGKAAQTAGFHQAALRKYISTALATGTLSPDSALEGAFTREVFVAVMRAWMTEEDSARQIRPRTMRSYLRTVARAATHCDRPADFMLKALTVNRHLIEGKRAEETMSLKARVFCARVMRDRRAEMQFRSMHLRFQEMARDRIASGSVGSHCDRQIIQLGVLAAFAAIELGGVPLRMSNALTLRHRGENPTLILPPCKRSRALILIPPDLVKNRKRIRAHIAPGRTRCLEVIEWYIREIRPRMPGADRSPYLFPGHKGGVISFQSVRNWLNDYTRELGLPMNPHNFRHGLTSLYLRDHPGQYGRAARLLGNTEGVVRAYYAWIDDEAEMLKVQEEVARMAGMVK